MSQKVIKAGNSLAVTIPSSFVRRTGITLGSEIKIETRPESNQLIISFPGAHQLSLSGASSNA